MAEVNEITIETEIKIQEYLSFISDSLHYVISAANIIEIIMNQAITRLPRVPDFIKGIINLRGQVIPIIDVRLRMNRPDIEYNEEACIIVININNICIGLLVEKVSHMVNINEEEIKPPPANRRQDLVNGIVNIDNKVYMVMDCDKLVLQT